MEKQNVEKTGEQKNCAQCGYKNTPRSEATVRQMQVRLHRIIGQLNAIDRMLGENRYCGDVLIQVAAVENGLRKLAYMILRDHLETCVVGEANKGNTKIIDETIDLIRGIK
ncbi:MAG: metal-sensing transcriptional repressor [Treponema sp.]|nr:metal-sensing transcriptional repressor [Treponema sp.]